MRALLSVKASRCPCCGRPFETGETDHEYLNRTAAPAREGLDIRFRSLSARERQIVDLIRQAKSNKEIAFELGLTVGTVKEYLHHVFTKLGVRNRTELALSSTKECARERAVTAQSVFDRENLRYATVLH